MFDFIKEAFGYWKVNSGRTEGTVSAIWKDIEAEELAIKYEEKQFENILLAYSRSFIEKEGVFYVGNHRLVENFNPSYVIRSFAVNKAEGRNDNCLVDTWYQDEVDGTSYYMLIVKATGERLNTMIPYAKEPATFRNFLEQLRNEYEKNMALILAEKNHIRSVEETWILFDKESHE